VNRNWARALAARQQAEVARITVEAVPAGRAVRTESPMLSLTLIGLAGEERAEQGGG